MERRNGAEGDVAGAGQHGEALEFVRFCHRRKRVGWPELYDEMCAVAGRGLYRGYGAEELASIGIGFTLFQMQTLASLVSRVVAEDLESRRRTAEAIRAANVTAVRNEVENTTQAEAAPAIVESPVRRSAPPPEPADERVASHQPIRLAVPAGA